MTSKIQEYIEKHKIKSSDCQYHTNRTVKGKKGIGKMRVLVHMNGVAMVEYTCPECAHISYTEEKWKRPFSIKCEKCGVKISVPKLREQMKREMKAEKKANSE
ncbi:MAG: hypothetical protein J4473_00995 [Candidatus Aenigmarchaeota archaeon]|nr:hypothetical protein [Candidatus Aenigmarchaeota archaeon]